MRPVLPTAPPTSLPAITPDSSTCSTTPLSGVAGYRKLSSENGGTINGTTSPSSQHHNKTSTRIALLIFFKGLFGAGVLAIPGAFESTGVPLGLLIFLSVSSLCLGTMLMLLRCKELLREEQGLVVENYEELAGAIFGPRAFRFCRFLMATITLIYTSGFVIVIGSSLNDVLPAVHRAVWCGLLFPVLTILSWIPFMKDLWFVSLLGLGTYLIGVVGSTIYFANHNYDSPTPSPWEWRWEGAPHFYGVAVYSLEGINLTLPVSASMKSLQKPPYVMTMGVCLFAGVTAFYSSYAYAAGLGSCDIIIQCLGRGAFVNIVRVALALSLIATHPVYLIVASEIFERALLGDPLATVPPITEEGEQEGGGVMPAAGNQLHGCGVLQGEEDASRRRTSEGTNDSSRLITNDPFSFSSTCSLLPSFLLTQQAQARIIRAIEVLLTCLVGACVPNLGAFTSLIGATFVTLIGFVFPAAMWWALQKEDVHASSWEKARVYGVAGLVILAGLVAMVVGTVESVRNIAK
ncbi:amino acid auxin permease family [Nannochloropsis oceanica]